MASGCAAGGPLRGSRAVLVGCGNILNTKKHLTIALDAMGGDLGPDMVIPGAALSAIRHPQMRFLAGRRQEPHRAACLSAIRI